MALDLTADGINEFYDVVHGIDNSLENIHHSLDAIVVIMSEISAQLRSISNNLNNLNNSNQRRFYLHDC